MTISNVPLHPEPLVEDPRAVGALESPVRLSHRLHGLRLGHLRHEEQVGHQGSADLGGGGLIL